MIQSGIWTFGRGFDDALSLGIFRAESSALCFTGGTDSFSWVLSGIVFEFSPWIGSGIGSAVGLKSLESLDLSGQLSVNDRSEAAC
jgi:hypothetical protein